MDDATAGALRLSSRFGVAKIKKQLAMIDEKILSVGKFLCVAATLTFFIRLQAQTKHLKRVATFCRILILLAIF